MQTEALTGGFANPPVEASRGFRAALNALARPGTIETVAGAEAPAPVSTAAAVLLLTLCDAETPLYLAPGHDGQAVRDWIAFHIGAPIADAGEAMFALGTWAALQPLAPFRAGTSEYPDRSVTLIVEMEALEQKGARLTGPGIREAAHLSLPEIAAFQTNRAAFPLGRDFYFCAGDRLAGLPRSTMVEAG